MKIHLDALKNYFQKVGLKASRATPPAAELSRRACRLVPYRSPAGAARSWKPSPRRCEAATVQRAR